jgi:hypothetical protein
MSLSVTHGSSTDRSRFVLNNDEGQVENARLDEPRHSRGNYEARFSRLEQIKMELAEMLEEFKRTRTILPS